MRLPSWVIQTGVGFFVGSNVGGLAHAPSFTLKKLECLKQASSAMNTLAWNNKIGLWFYFVGF